MKTAGNIIWVLFAGIWLFLGYVISGILNCIFIVTIPFGLQAFKLAGFVLWPFGRTVVDRPARVAHWRSLAPVAPSGDGWPATRPRPDRVRTWEARNTTHGLCWPDQGSLAAYPAGLDLAPAGTPPNSHGSPAGSKGLALAYPGQSAATFPDSCRCAVVRHFEEEAIERDRSPK